MKTDKILNDTQLPVWEVFVQSKAGRPHEHAGSIHASDPEMAIQNARDVYSRRGRPSSIWVVPAKLIHATRTEDEDMMFDPGDDKIYRHPHFYKVPRGVNIDVK